MWGWSLNVSCSDYRQRTLDVSLNFQKAASLCCENEWSNTPSYHGATAPTWSGPPHYQGFTITLRYTAFIRTPLDEWSARCRELYQTTHNTLSLSLSLSRERERERETSMTPAGFEPAISTRKRPQTHDLARVATRTDKNKVYSRMSRMSSSFLSKTCFGPK